MKAFQLLYNGPSGKMDIDLSTLGAIADAHASTVWENEHSRGEPFPVVDLDGSVCAYVFPYALGTSTFPADVMLAASEQGGSIQFGAIYVAAYSTEQPVLRVVHALHPLFLHGEEAVEMGRSILATENAHLTRIYWSGLHQEYFEVSTEDRRLLLDVRRLTTVDPDVALRSVSASMPDDQQVSIPQVPAPPSPKTLEPKDGPPKSILKLIPFAECVPAVNWTWWCVPTAWTMATCYYDNCVKGVENIHGYGRLVGYWFDHPKSGHNVPDFIDQIIDPKTGNWNAHKSYSDFIQKAFGYTFSPRDIAANAVNDWAWSDITTEIDAGRPFVWGVPDHATCAFGYRITTIGATIQKFVVLHTTWGDTSQSQREEWLHSKGTGLTAIIPGGATDGQNLALRSPGGDETLSINVPTKITWEIWGSQITLAEVSVSGDGGTTWTPIASTAPCMPGMNSCDWVPKMATDRARVRIRGRTGNGTYIAGDGSQRNFRVLAGSPPVKLKSIAIVSNSEGRLEIFAVGSDTGIYHIWQTKPNDGWSTWSRLGGTGDRAKSITIGENADGRLEVFAIGIDDGIYHIWQIVPSGGWRDWDRLSGKGDKAKNIIVGRNTDGRVEVFAIGTDSCVYHTWQIVPSGDWSPWDRLGGVSDKAKSIAVGKHADGRLAVFAIGTDDNIYHIWQTVRGDGWSPWVRFGAVSDKAQSIAVDQNADGRLELFILGANAGIYHAWQAKPNDDEWAALARLGGTGDRAKSITIGKNADGRLEVFAIGVDDGIYHIWQTLPNSNWSMWTRLGEAADKAKSIAVGQNADGRQEVFAIGSDDSIYHIRQKAPNGGWNVWTIL